MPHPSRLVLVKCRTCNKERKVPLSQYKKAKYGNFFCNPQCKGQWMYNLEDVNCSNCGIELKVNPYRLRDTQNVFCDRKCAGEFAGRKVSTICDFCGKELAVHFCRMKSQRTHFCNARCMGDWRSQNIVGGNNPLWIERVDIPCSRCGVLIKVSQWHIDHCNNQYCSSECRTEWKKQRYSGSGNPNWHGGEDNLYGIEFNKDLKEKVRNLYNRQCAECGDLEVELGETLHIHHVDYNKQNNTMSNLIPLCNSCHSKTNFSREEWINYFRKKILIQEGATTISKESTVQAYGTGSAGHPILHRHSRMMI